MCFFSFKGITEINILYIFLQVRRVRLRILLHFSILNEFVSSKIYDKRNDFDFDIENLSFLDRDVPRSTSYGVYISC